VSYLFWTLFEELLKFKVRITVSSSHLRINEIMDIKSM
jgi:hypothetical protein